MNICRICENVENLLCSLNDPKNCTIVEMLTDLANVLYSNDDQLPKFLCRKCQKSLQFAIEFKRQCEMTDRKLRQSLTLLRAEEETAGIADEFQSDSDMLQIEDFDTDAIQFVCLEKELNTFSRDTEDTSSSMQSDALKVVKKNQSAVSVDRRTCIICNIPFESISAMRRHKKLHVDPNFTCFYCDKRFKCNKKLECHVRIKHCSSEIRTFECFVCKKAFKNRRNCRYHYENMHTGNTHDCNLCSKSFTIRANLGRHLRLIHKGIKNHKCNFCHKLFGQKSVLDAHLATHSNERPFRCQVCDYTTKTSMALISHNINRHSINLAKNPRNPHRNPEHKPKRSYSRDPTFTTCEYCGKKINSFYYPTHIRTHTGEKPYQCKICTKSFSSNVTLTFHTYIHTGKYPYQCFICDQKFRQGNHLKQHILVHTGEKPHQCTFCSRTFSQRGNLTAHTRIHTGETPYHCTKCSNKFGDLNALKRHTKKYHT